MYGRSRGGSYVDYTQSTYRRKNHNVSTYAPIMKYEYNGVEYIEKTKYTLSSRDFFGRGFDKNVEYRIYIDPDNPSIYILDKWYKPKKSIVIVGIILILSGIYMLFLPTKI